MKAYNGIIKPLNKIISKLNKMVDKNYQQYTNNQGEISMLQVHNKEIEKENEVAHRTMQKIGDLIS